MKTGVSSFGLAGQGRVRSDQTLNLVPARGERKRREKLSRLPTGGYVSYALKTLAQVNVIDAFGFIPV